MNHSNYLNIDFSRVLTVLHGTSQDLLRNTYPAEHVLLADNDGNPEIEEKVEIIEKPGEKNLIDEVDKNKENESGKEDSEEYCGKSGNNLTKNR